LLTHIPPRRYGDAELLHPACYSTKGEGAADKIHPASLAGKPVVEVEEVDTKAIIAELSRYVFKYGTDRAKTRAMLCSITHNAIHDRFLEARDLLLMSHLQDTISTVGDTSTMILFNRMMVTLGLAAFRSGRIWEAHQCLTEIASNRVRELLAQGVNSGKFVGSDRNGEAEKAERRRQVPYHQHINTDLIEVVHLISAMLVEVPNMASEKPDTRRRVISRHFRKHMEGYERQAFVGPPENPRDFVMNASRSLSGGNWKGCFDMLESLDVWKLVAGQGSHEQIKKVLEKEIKEQGLRTFMFAFASNYDTISLDSLVEKFDLSKQSVHSIVSKMMISKEVTGQWDGPTNTININKVEHSRLQTLALQYCEKVSQLCDSNEKLLDSRSGVYGFQEKDFYANNWKDAGRNSRNVRGGYRANQRGGMRGVVGGGGRGGGAGGGGGGGGGGQRRQQWQ